MLLSHPLHCFIPFFFVFRWFVFECLREFIGTRLGRMVCVCICVCECVCVDSLAPTVLFSCVCVCVHQQAYLEVNIMKKGREGMSEGGRETCVCVCVCVCEVHVCMYPCDAL